MTCVVALRTDHSILLGSDSLASDTDIGVHRVDPKVFRLGEFGIGYGGSFRFGQIVQYFFNPPKITKKDKQDLFSYMIRKFVPELRKTLDRNDFDLEELVGCRLIVVVRGEIFYIEPDLHVGRDVDEFTAIGSGQKYAYGSLLTTVPLNNLSAYDKVSAALEAAAYFAISVSPPFHIIEVENEN